MFTAPNPGPKTLDGTHTFVVGRQETYVVDPGPATAQYQQFLAERLAANNHRVEGILLTHGHPDHAPGAIRLAELLRVPVWGSSRLQGSSLVVQIDERFTDDHHFQVDGDILRVLPTPGHAPDHVAFWLERAGVLFSGDSILGEGTTLVAPPEGNMVSYMRSLNLMRALRPRIIAPGHGPLVHDAMAKIDEYIEHRRRREAQLLEALGEGPANLEELVQRTYVTTPSQLLPLAKASAEAQLIKLREEGKVEERTGKYYLAG